MRGRWRVTDEQGRSLGGVVTWEAWSGRSNAPEPKQTDGKPKPEPSDEPNREPEFRRWFPGQTKLDYQTSAALPQSVCTADVNNREEPAPGEGVAQLTSRRISRGWTRIVRARKQLPMGDQPAVTRQSVAQRQQSLRTTPATTGTERGERRAEDGEVEVER
ncbi:hypothetical protein P153DRAFT_382028 [Dothidotthia symphoricarpi CBS 119687]|uniref:Uncharacterized protein n=1 Tax=Dothidotthia symphoricarpi CBS 119687 TaxID=1392245 RepID=A0A6A6ARX1_9PLEO|nr:uncharacterized protein P153DRAFT_382028 [Dothidotthia symphoricarpi CBS 119687]KAF2133597.1 hypothetical protein P153DRAFT_382028 [Dothidotthia symphoricarpi CBS 119687]